MREALQALLRQASDAKRSVDFWRGAATILSDWAGGARLAIRYQGINESGTVAAGADDRSGRSITAEWRDPEGRRVEATLAGAPPALPVSELEAAIEFCSRLAVMVGRRAALERERWRCAIHVRGDFGQLAAGRGVVQRRRFERHANGAGRRAQSCRSRPASASESANWQQRSTLARPRMELRPLEPPSTA